jgi:hypothetical protein
MALTQISTGMLASGDGTVDLNIDNGTFVVDVSTSRVGIGETTPTAKLEVAGIIKAGDLNATGGGVYLTGKYGDNLMPNIFGAMYSSAFNLIGYGVRSHATNSNTFLSTVDNAAWTRGALQVGSELIFSNAAAQTTAVGSNVTMTERFRINFAGNVGIGNSNPTNNLTIGTNLGSGYVLSAHTSTAYGLVLQTTESTPSANSALWVRNDDDGTVNTLFRVNNNGKVGIGIDNPSLSFHAYHPTTNVIGRFESGDAQVWIDLHDSNSGAYGALLGHDSGAGDLFKVANASVDTKFVIKNDGSIQIGNNLPMWSGSYGGALLLKGNNGTSDRYGQLSIVNSSGTLLYDGLVVNNVGNVGIGTTTPAFGLHVNIAGGTVVRFQSSYGYMGMGPANSSYAHHNTDRPAYYFPVNCQASGGFTTYSDSRLKENVEPVTGALDKVAIMNGVTFTWDNSEKAYGPEGKQFGVLAQNMLEVDSELPSLREDALESQENIDNPDLDTQYYTMDYSRLTPFFIEAIKELKTKLEAAEARLAALENN